MEEAADFQRLAAGCLPDACEAMELGWVDDGTQSGACTMPADDNDDVRTWQQMRTDCLSWGSTRWATATELSLRAQRTQRRDWAADAQQMQADRFPALEKLRKENAELEKTVATLEGLLKLADGRRCYGPQ
jgi:hypothetical protein